MNIRKHNNLMPIAGGVGLGLLLLAMICPSPQSSANAQDARTDIDLTVNPTIAIAMSPQVSMEITPRADGNFASSGSDIYISTNSDNGFKLMLGGVNGTDLTPSNTSSSAKISSLSAPAKAGNFDDNTWGYYLGSAAPNADSIYMPIPGETTQIDDRDSSNGLERYNLSFGTQVTTSLPADTYSGSVVVSAIANPVTLTSLRQLTYMQQMTKDICENTKLETTKQLIDTRDGKSYWVAKLADSRCWMVQNLALDLGIDDNGNAAAVTKTGELITLTNENTELTQPTWNAGTSLAPSTTSATVPESMEEKSTLSFTAGNVLLLRPQETADMSNCSAIETGELATIADSCPAYVKKITPEMRDDYVATTESSYDQGSNFYDSHYLLGNYYTFGAATAGTWGKTEYKHYGSICPKGWYMPNNDTQVVMLGKYGLKSKLAATITNDDGSTSDYHAAMQPLYYVRAGKVFPNSYFNVNSSGDYWSSTFDTVGGVTGVYNHYLTRSSASAWGLSNPNNKAFSLRCVSHQQW